MKTSILIPIAFGVVAQNGPPAWMVMWWLVVTIYAGFKGIMWRKAIRGGVRTTRLRSFLFLVLWPGMDAQRFLDTRLHAGKPALAAWLVAGANMALGAVLLWGGAHAAGHGLLAGWIGMTGLIFLLHFGVFKMLAFFWQQNGICAQPLMHMPIAAKSVSDFWSKRWNSAFRDLSFGLLFGGFRKQCGVRAATMLTFIVSGLIHDLVISVPAGTGYGLPTAYFTFQGAGMLFEHSHIGALLRLRGNWRGRLFAWAVIAGPIFTLFSPVFVLRVIVPFMQAIKAL